MDDLGREIAAEPVKRSSLWWIERFGLHKGDLSRVILERLVEAGRDVEAQVLARAVTWHADHRVLLNGNRTVVLGG